MPLVHNCLTGVQLANVGGEELDEASAGIGRRREEYQRSDCSVRCGRNDVTTERIMRSDSQQAKRVTRCHHASALMT